MAENQMRERILQDDKRRDQALIKAVFANDVQAVKRTMSIFDRFVGGDHYSPQSSELFHGFPITRSTVSTEIEDNQLNYFVHKDTWGEFKPQAQAVIREWDTYCETVYQETVTSSAMNAHTNAIQLAVQALRNATQQQIYLHLSVPQNMNVT